MTDGAVEPGIRVASQDEFALLREIEDEADRLFEAVGIGPFSDCEEENHLSRAAVVFASGTPAVGFTCVEIVDGQAHIWQLSVHPKARRQGRGRALVQAVCEWASSKGYPAVTLTTFRDVPWNGPFYAEMGFYPVRDLSPELMAIRQHEQAIGDDDFGPRIAMRKDLQTAGQGTRRRDGIICGAGSGTTANRTPAPNDDLSLPPTASNRRLGVPFPGNIEG